MQLIDLTKKIACAAIAVSAFVFSGCNPDETGKNEEPVIKITPDNIEFDYRADEAVVTVESSADWTLFGTYDWVSPSISEGTNGSKVTFTVEDNVTGNTRTASYTFAIQGAEQKLVIKQNGGELDMNMTLSSVAVSTKDATLSLTVESEDIELFSNWGIIYSLTETMDGGKEIELEGVPAAGTQEVTVTGLTANTTYYFWAYCEDISGTRHYTKSPLTATTEPEEEDDTEEMGDMMYLFVNAGGQEVKYEIPKESDSDWYYRMETGSTLNGYKYRLSFNAETGYPAYVCDTDGGYKRITDASGMVEMKAESSQANACVVSFCKSENVCVVKDIFYKSTTVTVVGDVIVTSYNEDWNAWKAYSEGQNFFAPADKMREPHIWSITATFKKNDSGEGFKLITDGGWDNCIMSDTSGANPIDTWCPGTYQSSNDWKWKPSVEGSYKVLFDFSTMKLKMEAAE